MSLWLIMIILHTVFAVTCFNSGLLLLSPQKARKQPKLLSVFIASLVAMIVFMVAATISHWVELSVVEKVAFSGLPLLGIYMLYRAINASKELKNDNYIKYINGIGFSLISLFNGFAIVGLFDLGANPIFIPVVAILGTFIGSKFVTRVTAKQLNTGS